MFCNLRMRVNLWIGESVGVHGIYIAEKCPTKGKMIPGGARHNTSQSRPHHGTEVIESAAVSWLLLGRALHEALRLRITNCATEWSKFRLFKPHTVE